MGLPLEKPAYLTPEDYLRQERQAEFKSEYYRGEVFAMSGARLEHNRLVANLIISLGARLSGSGCEVFPSDLRLHIPETTLYTYPDVMVVCGKPEMLDEEFDTLLNPRLIVEVQSESTANYDRGNKAMLYRRIASLQDYVMIDSTMLSAAVLSRTAEEGVWNLRETTKSTDELILPSLGLRLPLEEVYRGVDFNEQNNK
ncbi:MAG TPA: Uma2 family endonuclease [Hymenobacter sp.]|nr:Uma2 family endonuclease [Hymenobacter sp.]